MNALEIYVNSYMNTALKDEVPVDIETYLDAVEGFGALVVARDPRAVQAYVYAEDLAGHDPEVDHMHTSRQSAEIMSKALLAYAGSIENGWAC